MNSDKYLDIFAREAEEHLDTLRQGVLRMEKEGCDQTLVLDMLRSAHTLKGSARLLGLQDLSRVAHKLEEILKSLVGDERDMSENQVDLLLLGTDGLEALIAGAHSGGEVDVHVDNLLETLDGRAPQAEAKKVSDSVADKEKGSPDTVRTSIDKLDGITNLLGEMMISRDIFDQHGSKMRGLLRRLEVFLGSLRRAENYHRLKSILDDFDALHHDLQRDTLNLNYLTEYLHDQAMSLRQMPLSVLIPTCERLVRDLAKEQDKSLELSVTGDDVELDRMMIEAIKPMLLHLMRNAVDHGIEAPPERRKAGKNPGGHIHLSARYERGGVKLELSDDGRGIDPALVRRTAVDRKILSDEEAQSLNDEDAVYLILRPGFSTREIITDISGRGVGMDVVKAQIDRIKGNLTILSTPGQGARIIIELPLTMATINGLIVQCGPETYAVPMHYLERILRLTEKDILDEGNREVIRYQDRTLPLLDLRQLLGLPQDGQTLQRNRYTALVLRYGGNELACLVSETQGVQTFVVKETGTQLESVLFFSGVTILGSGIPALILSIPDIFDAFIAGDIVGRHIQSAVEPDTVQGRILVVDDSITTRTMEKNILETHGYDVVIAIDGDDALEKLRQNAFDLVVTDIEMPGLDGFELTERLRQMEEHRDVPVVIVSSRTSDEDKRRGIKVGAQAYIVKNRFDQGTLLQTVQTLIG
ncbi:MAG TPA: response regulator [Desulfuromonadales bacterium]|nr:response regulator [Desulfuromonadales bacterium]